MMEAFRLDLDGLEDFYRRCMARGAKTEKERVAILREIVTELRAIKLNETDLKRVLKGKKILRIKGDTSV